MGAYGSRIVADLPGDRFAVLGDWAWPGLTLDFEPSPTPRPGDIVHPTHGGSVCFDPIGRQARVPLPVGSTLEDVIHPAVTVAAFVAARSRGDEAIHGGAFALNGGAWVILGDHERGKSTLLALLARRGHDVLADDMTVISDQQVCAGTRCLDLRPGAAAHLGVGDPARGETRMRVGLPPVRAEHPLRGFLHLAWAPQLGIRKLPGGERLARLVDEIAHLPRREPMRLLDFAGLPHYELSRPRHFNSAERSAALVEEQLSQADD